LKIFKVFVIVRKKVKMAKIICLFDTFFLYLFSELQIRFFLFLIFIQRISFYLL